MASYTLGRRSVRLALAEQSGEQEVFTQQFLPEQLLDVIEKSPNAMARVRAIELAAEIAGIVQPSARKKGRFLPGVQVGNKGPAISKDLAKRIEAFEEGEKAKASA